MGSVFWVTLSMPLYACVLSWCRLTRTISKRWPHFPVSAVMCSTALTAPRSVMDRARSVQPVILAEGIQRCAQYTYGSVSTQTSGSGIEPGSVGVVAAHHTT